MATDIWPHIEYLSKKKKVYVLAPIELEHYDFNNYFMFCAMGGGHYVRGVGIKFPARGLPNDISQEIFKEQNGEPDFHTKSWLTTEELKECIDYVKEICVEKFDYTLDAADEYLEAYTRAYKYMKECDDEGEPARLVFWFDN